MRHTIRISAADNRTLDLPASLSRGTHSRTFIADQPASAAALDVVEVRLTSEGIDCPVRFVFGLHIVETEAGLWTVTLNEDDDGPSRWHLEYYTTEHFGRKVRNPPVFQWDHETEDMMPC